LRLRKARLGPDHPDTLQSMGSVAVSYYALGRQAEALKLQEETLALRKARLGPDHPETLRNMGNLAVCHDSLDRHAEALTLCEETLAREKAALGPDHPETLKAVNNLAASYSRLGRHAEALKLFEETLALQRTKLGPDHPSTLLTMGNVATCYLNLGRHAECLKLRQETLALRRSKLGPEHPDTLESMWRVTESLVGLHRGAEAVPIIDEFLKGAVGKSIRPDMIVRMIGFRMERRATDAAGCRAMAEMCEKLQPADATSRYNIACILSITAARIRASDKSEAAVKDATAEADRAMAWLKQAVAAGWKDAEHVKKDRDLDALRDREDFKKLLVDLEADQQKQNK